MSLGIEAQLISFELVSRTVRELETDSAACVRVLHGDLRDTSLLPADCEGSFDCITANPPFSVPKSGPHCKDEQRTFARFALRGGIEEYVACASRLLKPCGRFVVAYWQKEDGVAQVGRAAARNAMRVVRRVDVVGGAPGNEAPHISIFELSKTQSAVDASVTRLDITRDAKTGGMGQMYKDIQAALLMQKRPLKTTTTFLM